MARLKMRSEQDDWGPRAANRSDGFCVEEMMAELSRGQSGAARNAAF